MLPKDARDIANERETSRYMSIFVGKLSKPNVIVGLQHQDISQESPYNFHKLKALQNQGAHHRELRIESTHGRFIRARPTS